MKLVSENSIKRITGKGFYSSKVWEIVDGAKVSVGTVYNNFDSKKNMKPINVYLVNIIQKENQDGPEKNQL